MRDIVLADTAYIAFTSRAFATGIPTVLAGTPVVSAYEDAGLTQITAGITLGVDHDGVVGLNMLTIVATGANGYEDDKDYNLVITTGTVGGVSAVGEVVGQFSIQRAPVNWANVSNPTTALDLSGTDIQLVDTTTTNTDMAGTNNALLAASAPTNFGDLAITVTTGLTSVGTNNDKTGYALTVADWNTVTPLDAAGIRTAVGLASANMDTQFTASATATGFNVGKTGYSLTTADWNTVVPDAAGVAPTAAEVVNEWETQSQADPTGFHVNVREWLSVAATSLETAASVNTAVEAGQVGIDAAATNVVVDNLNLGIIYGLTTGTPTTTSTNTDLTGYLDAELVGGVIVFTGGTADGQRADILTYTATSGVVTFAALTTAPAASDPFKIV